MLHAPWQNKMRKTIPHPAPEVICGSHQPHPVRDSKR